MCYTTYTKSGDKLVYIQKNRYICIVDVAKLEDAEKMLG